MCHALRQRPCDHLRQISERLAIFQPDTYVEESFRAESPTDLREDRHAIGGGCRCHRGANRAAVGPLVLNLSRSLSVFFALFSDGALVRVPRISAHNARVICTVRILAIPLVLSSSPIYAMARGLNSLEELWEGAKEGFRRQFCIIPFLVTMLVGNRDVKGARRNRSA